MERATEYYYKLVEEHLRRRGLWEETVKKFPPLAIRRAVEVILERMYEYDLDPELLDWGSLFEKLRDFKTVYGFIKALEERGEIPPSREEVIGASVEEIEKELAKLLELAKDVDVEILRRVRSRLAEELGEVEELAKLKREIEELREKIKTERRLKEEYAKKYEELERRLSELQRETIKLRGVTETKGMKRETPKEEYWKYFAEKLRKEGLTPERYREEFEAEWPSLEGLPDESIRRALDILASEIVRREKAVPPPAVPVPRPPVRPPTAVPRPYWQVITDSKALSYILTFGVERFLEEEGGKYGLTLYDTPGLSRVLLSHINRVAERLVSRPTNMRYYIAGRKMYEHSSRIARSGIYPSLKFMWSSIILQARELYRASGYNAPEDVTFILTDKRKVRYSGGRAFVESVACLMYRALGVKDEDIPEDLRRAEKMIEIWISRRMPVGDVVIKREEVRV